MTPPEAELAREYLCKLFSNWNPEPEELLVWKRVFERIPSLDRAKAAIEIAYERTQYPTPKVALVHAALGSQPLPDGAYRWHEPPRPPRPKEVRHPDAEDTTCHLCGKPLFINPPPPNTPEWLLAMKPRRFICAACEVKHVFQHGDES